MKCRKCGKEFNAGNREDGLPNGIGMLLRDGRMIDICTECVMKIGQMTDAERDAFFREIDAGIQ